MNARALIENVDDDIKREAMSSDWTNELTRLGYEQVAPGYWRRIYEMPEWRKSGDYNYQLNSVTIHATDYYRDGTRLVLSVHFSKRYDLAADYKSAIVMLAKIDELVRQFGAGNKPVRRLSQEFRRLGFK